MANTMACENFAEPDTKICFSAAFPLLWPHPGRTYSGESTPI